MLKDIILQKRKDKKMTQEQLAEHLDVARQTVSKWELGETLPDVENLKKMAILLEFSIDEALGIEVENDDNDDETDWLMFGGFIIGSALGIYLDNPILMFVCTMIGYGASFFIKVLRKR